MSDIKEVWDTLSKINVNEHTNTKNNFTYLSWTWAWATLQENYPQSTYKFKPDMFHQDGSCEVWVELTIEGVTREMWLAVTDFRNKPVAKPSCDLIANARMRCLVKAIAMFGLGHYIYAGESLPMQVNELAQKEAKLDPSIVKGFNACSNLSELQLIWSALSKDQQKIFNGVKNEIKGKLS